MLTTYGPQFALILTLGTAVATALLIWLMHPLLVRYAMARPNARSSHTEPTPQGGGIAVVIAVVTVMASCALHGLPEFREPWVMRVLASIVLLAVIGAIDDIRPLPVPPRILLQFGAACLLVSALPHDAQILPWLPGWIETALMVIALVWFINLTNFMDGIDWMTVAQAVPVLGAMVVLGITGRVPALATVLPVALALLGGILGFAPFNRHVARLFLGDVGSLPVGALLGWLLLLMASTGYLLAALILPMYYLADATITLFRRFRRGERVWLAHRSHFYQIATQRGFAVTEVTARVFGLNTVLALLAILSVIARDNSMRFLFLVLAVGATAAVLREFECGPNKPSRQTQPSGSSGSGQ